MLDRAGRLQLPKQHIAALELQHRVRLRLEDDHVGVWPDKDGREGRYRLRRGDGHRRRDRRIGPMSALSAAEAARYGGSVEPLVEAVDLVRDYPVGDSVVHAVRAINLSIAPGELIAIRGRSGSGKTTLLNLLGGLDQPTSGKVVVDGLEISSMSEDDLVDVRRRTVAFVFQAFGLVPFLTAAENVEVPLRLVHAERSRARRAGGDAARRRRAGGSGEAPAARAVGRRAAARRPGPGARERPEAPPRRRADRPARLRHRAT